jgi:hypothetical protein
MGYSELHRRWETMTRPAKEIVNAAIKLTESERLQIVEELLLTWSRSLTTR